MSGEIDRARAWLELSDKITRGKDGPGGPAPIIRDLLAIIHEVGCSGVESESSRYTTIQIDNDTWEACRDHAAAEAAKARQANP